MQQGAKQTQERTQKGGIAKTCGCRETTATRGRASATAAAQEKKREAANVYDKLAKGEVNDFIIDAAISNDKVRPKLVKVLASRLREAKLRKLAFEQANKGSLYTYTALDLKNFEHWDRVKAECPDVKDPSDCDSGDVSGAGRGGSTAKAIQAMVDKLPSVHAMTPPPPSEFAAAFFNAKRACVPTLKEKLAAIDADHADGLLTEEEVTFYKAKIKHAHYLGSS